MYLRKLNCVLLIRRYVNQIRGLIAESFLEVNLGILYSYTG